MIDSLSSLAQKAMDEALSLSRYRVAVHECSDFLDVLRYSAVESLSQPWRYDVAVTCSSADIACDTLLLKPASFTFMTPVFDGTPALPVRTVYGVVESFRRISTSNDDTRYAMTIVPRIALLDYTKGSEIYLNQSVTEVVEKVLRKHGLEGPDFEFRLSREYPSRELITQWRETDLEFIQRLLAEVGIYWRYEMDSLLEQDVVIFQDSQQQYEFGVTLPLRNQAGMSDSGQESIWDIQTAYNVVSGRVATRDYNYREALQPQDSAESIFSKEGITTGETYHYAEPFLTAGDAESAESGAYFARLRHERILNAQYHVTGHSSSPHLAPGQVLETDGTLPDAVREGIVITTVRSSGSRKSSFSLTFEGIPYSETVCWRPALLSRPVISGSLPARVESTQKGDTCAWLDQEGRYRVKLDFDHDSTEQGYAYLWLRLAKPYAGDTYGFHSPLIDGTEVAVVFDGGDPDRPYIAYALHDSEHPDHVTSENHTRNVWRTPANNKLRMEDKRGEEHIKLATEYGKTQLNMGHLVNGQREKRGAGFELRTDEYGAVRAAKGLFLTADEQAKAQGPVLEMAPAINQINQANSQMQALNSAAEAAGALICDINTQINFVTDKIKDLQSAVLLGSAPQGVALTSGEHLQLSSTRNTMINAGQHLDIGAMKNLSVTVEKALGLFVHKEGAKLVANQGDIEIQAQHNTMSLFSEKQLTVTSSEDEIIISTPETLTLNGGGSYLRLSKNGIEHGSSGEFIMKTSDYLVPGSGANLPNETPNFSLTDITQESKISSKSFND
ncbi:type VI secretion system tip protein VgrG [Klebsiella pneumoniae]|uniref:type VI secretion system Vgr family protein n=1 Tax=Klebsiella TaxID=570 RepID=UPI0009B94D76|nr:type VI secretion system Vgr family protein [Klebsiella pneumoniae]HBQ6090402.1 type VI secretion system tip protein VgrG [Klebsiella pneumoniae subsp. pneumoniae]EIX9479149.1 type VI secretion system tip protein VgrG [Klebsiella pneumoniae]EKW2891599.1 type VI secretion system tip protein VgrG [Klebsiella pneumoniae]ELA0628239.1 type VI secretion system tip protein VgrG [Klebsiella pneumoniae]ELZ2232846.1 type VI secretion system tip protein VgrG [Klebsiella pneumoniae]